MLNITKTKKGNVKSLFLSGKKLLLATILLTALPVIAQVSTYRFSQTYGTYTPITGGTILGDTTNQNQSFELLPIGFTFTYNGTEDTVFSLNTDGFITFEPPAISSYNPISTGVSQTVVSVFGSNIQAKGGSELRYETIGTAPYRQCVIQWSAYTDITTYDNYSFQIKLYETTNQIDFVYGNIYTAIGGAPVEVGLTANPSSDYINRTTSVTYDWNITTAGSSAFDYCEISQVDTPPSGLTFSWKPPFDISAYSLENPMAAHCYSSSEFVVVEIKNVGFGTIDLTANPVTVNGSVTGINPATFGSATLSTGSLDPGQWLLDTVSWSYDMSFTGDYNFSFNTFEPSDINTYNDTINDTIHFNGLPFSTAYGSAATVCEYDYFGAHDTVWGGTPPYSYYWDDGATSYYSYNIGLYPGTPTSFTVTATDDVGCTTVSYISVGTNPLTDITGTVLYQGNPITSGSVCLYFTSCGCSGINALNQSTNLDASGNYTFTGIGHNSYRILVTPDTFTYPNLIPTYYGDTTLWNLSSILNHDCSAASIADVNLKGATNTGTGTGVISGYVYEGPNYLGISSILGNSRNQGEPIPGLDIKLGHNPGGGIAINTYTDSTGYYQFSNIDPGQYDIYVDIIGLGRITIYDSVIIAASDVYTDMNYCADSVNVYTCLITDVSEHKQNNSFEIYPNPTKGVFEISSRFNENKFQISNVKIINVLGEKINTKLEKVNDKWKVDLGETAEGIYFVQITTPNGTIVLKIVKE